MWKARSHVTLRSMAVSIKYGAVQLRMLDDSDYPPYLSTHGSSFEDLKLVGGSLRSPTWSCSNHRAKGIEAIESVLVSSRIPPCEKMIEFEPSRKLDITIDTARGGRFRVIPYTMHTRHHSDRCISSAEAELIGRMFGTFRHHALVHKT